MWNVLHPKEVELRNALLHVAQCNLVFLVGSVWKGPRGYNRAQAREKLRKGMIVKC